MAEKRSVQVYSNEASQDASRQDHADAAVGADTAPVAGTAAGIPAAQQPGDLRNTEGTGVGSEPAATGRPGWLVPVVVLALLILLLFIIF